MWTFSLFTWLILPLIRINVLYRASFTSWVLFCALNQINIAISISHINEGVDKQPGFVFIDNINGFNFAFPEKVKNQNHKLIQNLSQ